MCLKFACGFKEISKYYWLKLMTLACKVIIKQRMCNSGMRWTDEGSKNILVLRCFNETDGKWKQFWDKVTKIGY